MNIKLTKMSMISNDLRDNLSAKMHDRFFDLEIRSVWNKITDDMFDKTTSQITFDFHQQIEGQMLDFMQNF